MASDRPAPLLRSPPFPGIPVAVAAVSTGPHLDDPVPLDSDLVEATLAVVRDARVSGVFWGDPASARADMIVRAESRQPLTGISPSALWVVPAADRARSGTVDPWSLLAPGITLVAHGDDEWVAVATIVGADVDILSPGCFGLPGDTGAVLRQRVTAHLLACRYRDPFTGASCTFGNTVALLMLWRDQVAANRAIAAAAGIAWWKRTEIRRFLWAPRSAALPFLPAGRAIRHAAPTARSVAVWPSRVPADIAAQATRAGVGLVQVEDGFVRSVGLGANLVPPLSVTVDRIGIYYDPSRPSGLEQLIEDGDFPPALIARAAALRTRIVADRISKYGSAPDTPFPVREPGRRLVLVPGQVEDDRSVLLGGGAVAGNLDLLRRVRRAEPAAEIWFRPHPDVDAGHRRGGADDVDALRHVDRVVRGGSMASLLGIVDAVHVLTSLTGFEALLRGLDVVCHGVPFFAGWGLTRDLATVPDRRTRRASLDELVAATLILYPRYLDPVTMLPCPPETLIARIASTPDKRAGPIVALRRMQGRLMRRF